MDLMIFRSHHINNNNNDEKRTLNALIKRTRIWTHRWIYERFVSYEPLCFKRVIFVQNERKIELNFFWKKTWDFYSFPLLGQQFWAVEAGGEKNESDTFDSWWPRILLLSSFVGCFFCRRKFVVSLAQKRRKKTSVWLFPLLYIYEGERHKNTTERTTRRTANNKIRILINGDERESLHVIR